MSFKSYINSVFTSLRNVNADLKLSVFYGTAGRAITLANQILSVPLIIILIGLDSFNRFNILIASVSWFASLGGSLVPSLVGDITRANARSDLSMLTKHIVNVLITLTIFIALCSVIFSVVFWPPELDLIIVFALTLCILIFSVSDNIRQGTHETYKNSWFNGFANLFSVCLLYFAFITKQSLDVHHIALIMLGSTALFKLLNFILVKRHLSLDFSKSFFDVILCKKIILSARYFVVIAISFYLTTGGLLTITNKFAPNELPYVIMLQKFTLTLMGIMVMIRSPLWSIIAKEIFQKNVHKVHLLYKKYFLILIALLLPIYIVVYFFTPSIVSLWTNYEVQVNPSYMCAFSFYFCAQTILYFNSIFYYGLEMFSEISLLLFFESVIACLSAYLVLSNSQTLDILYLCLGSSSLVLNVLLFKSITARFKLA